jgi:ABC-2 type transport system permease protein
MWRVRNVLQIFLVFFLWSTIYSDPGTQAFGYDRDKILTYVFGILIIRAIVLSARTVDVAGEISNGDITNLLLKPINYFKYWFTRDISSKALNLGFAVVETTALYFILKPPFFIQKDPGIWIAFIVSLILAVFMFFTLLFLVNLIAFWIPTAGWAAQFLVIVIFTEYLSGGIFPIDIFPKVVQKIIYALPFPYLLFFPLQIYLGKLSTMGIVRGLAASSIWLIILGFIVSYVWNKGLKQYAAEGR